MRLRERQRPEQQGVHNAKHGSVEACTECENQDRYGGKSRVVPKGTERVARVLRPLVKVLTKTSTTFHVLSYSLARLFDDANAAELALGLASGRLRKPAMGDQVFCLALNMETQFSLDVGLQVRTENAIVPAPQGDLRHVVS